MLMSLSPPRVSSGPMDKVRRQRSRDVEIQRTEKKPFATSLDAAYLNRLQSTQILSVIE